jgi:error-prone DNA polymerase
MALSHRRRPDDALRLFELDTQARAAGVRSVATGDVLYHAPEVRLLQDVVTAIWEKCTVDELGFRRELHADRALKAPDEMVRRFRDYPDAIAATREIASRCRFGLGELSYQYPHERQALGQVRRWFSCRRLGRAACQAAAAVASSGCSVGSTVRSSAMATLES